MGGKKKCDSKTVTYYQLITYANPSYGKSDLALSKEKQKIPQFQVGYMWLTSLKRHKTFIDQVHKTTTKCFVKETLKSIKHTLNTKNTCVFSLITFYEHRKVIMFQDAGKKL